MIYDFHRRHRRCLKLLPLLVAASSFIGNFFFGWFNSTAGFAEYGVRLGVEKTKCIVAVPASRRFCVVLASDSKYMPCALKLIKSLRTLGQFNETLAFIISSKTELEVEHVASLIELGVILRPVVAWSNHTHRGSTAAYHRMNIFTDVYFRQFDAVLYLDADGFVLHDIRPIFQALLKSNSTLLMRDNGIGMGKHDLFKNEFSGVVPGVRNTLSPGASTVMAVNMKKLPPAKTLDIGLKNVLDAHAKHFKYADQGLINAFFRDEYQIMWPCVGSTKIISPDSEVEQNWHGGCECIYAHDHLKKCLLEDTSM